VIVTRNNYELGLMNGDIGIVRPDADGRLRVWFEDPQGGTRSVVPAFLSNCETVFAMTIHKSQGSEFDKVLVVLPEGTDNPLLTRELLYTGVTRAREEVVIQGSRETLRKAVESQVERISGIGRRINGKS
jgi:exodeoxyribonuclease V alpha subunit